MMMTFQMTAKSLTLAHKQANYMTKSLIEQDQFSGTAQWEFLKLMNSEKEANKFSKA